MQRAIKPERALSPGGEDDVSSSLSPHRERSLLLLAHIGRSPVSLSSVAKSADVIPCVNEKVLMVNSAVNEESVVRLAAVRNRCILKAEICLKAYLCF